MHAYQVAIDFINNHDGKAKQGQKPYRLLHKLAKAKNVYMHGSQPFIGMHFNISPNKMNKLARDALKEFCTSGVLQIPDQFKFNENRIYRHDGNPDANRNVWSESNNCKNDKFKKEPVMYTLNKSK
jgi:hypothetical protein